MVIIRSLFPILFMCSLVTTGYAQNVKTLRLNPQNIPYAPKNFFLKTVVDDRANKSAIGEIEENGNKQSAGIEKGLTACFEGIIANHITQSRSTQPVILHINKLNFDIKKVGSVWKIDASAAFSFYVGDEKLLDFNGKGQGETSDDPGDYIETFIRQTFENDLKKFDAWWEKNKGSVVTSSTVKVNVSIGKVSDVPNTIVYSLQRPLKIADFEGVAGKSNQQEMAATLSGMGFGYYTESENGQLVIYVTVTPYFEKSGSWFKEAGKTQRLLSHEQLHFDITAIKACELVATIRKANITPDNYKTVLDQLQKENLRKSGEEENLYDEETKHGTIPAKQSEWEMKIKADLMDVGCYN